MTILDETTRHYEYMALGTYNSSNDTVHQLRIVLTLNRESGTEYEHKRTTGMSKLTKFHSVRRN